MTISSYRCYLKLIFCFSLLLFYACEYDSNEMNYHELTPPEKEVSATFNLADIPEGNMIYIYNNTYLTYNLNVSSGTIISKEFFLNGQSINSSNGYIVLSPSKLQGNTTNTIKVKVKTTSATGSLAEILGGEKDEFEFSYSVKYVNPNIDLNIRQRVSNDKHLELYWDKPQIEGVEIESYTIYNYNNFDDVLVSKITNPDQTSYVDENYVYGVKTVRVVVKYKSNVIAEKEDFYTIKYDEFTSKHFLCDISRTGDLLISWNNPNMYTCKYVFEDNKNNKTNLEHGISNTIFTEYAFPQDQEMYFKLYILPVNANYSDYAKYPSVIFNYKDKNLGYSHYGNLAVDVTNSLILGITPYNSYQNHTVNVYDMANDFKLIQTNPAYESGNYFAEEILASRKGKIGIYYRTSDNGSFSTFSNYMLNSKKSTVNSAYWVQHYLGDNDKYFVNNHQYSLRIYDINTGNLILTTTENNREFGTKVSASGKYVFNGQKDDKWYNLYEFDGTKLNLLKSSSTGHTGLFWFSPYDEKFAIMEKPDYTFLVVNVPELTTVTKINGKFMGFDPSTGNILYKEKVQGDFHYFRVRNSTFDKDIFQIITKYGNDLQLINGYLFYNRYNYINISKAL